MGDRQKDRGKSIIGSDLGFDNHVARKSEIEGILNLVDLFRGCIKFVKGIKFCSEKDAVNVCGLIYLVIPIKWIVTAINNLIFCKSTLSNVSVLGVEL